MATFIPAVARAWSLEDVSLGSALSAALQGNVQLGLHTGVVVKRYALDKEGGVSFRENAYVFSSQSKRPQGVSLPFQCPGCCSLYSFKNFRKADKKDLKKKPLKKMVGALKEDEAIHLYDCGHCGAVSSFKARRALSSVPCGGEGAWLVFDSRALA